VLVQDLIHVIFEDMDPIWLCLMSVAEPAFWFRRGDKKINKN
jgi:hypothetical protein